METSLVILLFMVLALLTGIVVRQLLKNSGIPYSVALLLIGLLLGLGSLNGYLTGPLDEIDQTIRLAADVDAHIIMFIFLPALIFESTFSMEVHLFRRMFSQIALLAVPGLIISTVLTALLCTYLLPWQWSFPVALMFGAIVSATDPVAVVSLLKEMCSRVRLQTLIEGESLLNDGTAIVLFSLFFTMATHLDSTMNIPHVVIEFIRVVAIGALCGVILAYASLTYISRVFNDSMIEIALTLSMPYLAFFIAEHLFHASGVVAVVTLALCYAGPGRTRFSPEVVHHMHQFWEMLSYLFNTIIFLLVGIIVAERFSEASMDAWAYLAVLYIGILIIRALSILVLMPLLSRLGVGITREKAIVLTWGGLRGAVSLALALTVVTSTALSQEVRDQVLFLAAGIVVLTIVINGSTMRALMSKLGLDQLPLAKQRTLFKAGQKVTEEVSQVKQKIEQDPLLARVNWNEVNDVLASLDPEVPPQDSKKEDINIEYKRKLLESERQYYWNQFSEGLLSREATTLLNNAIEQALDGNPKIYPRTRLLSFWETAGYTKILKKLPFTTQKIYQQQVLMYESARGFMLAQNELIKLATSLSLEDEQKNQALSDIDSNIKGAQRQIEFLGDQQQGLVEKIETHIALRMLLNKQRNGLENLAHNGVISEADAEKLIAKVELTMREADG